MKVNLLCNEKLTSSKIKFNNSLKSLKIITNNNVCRSRIQDQVAVAVAVAGLTKRFFNHIQKDFLINVLNQDVRISIFNVIRTKWQG